MGEADPLLAAEAALTLPVVPIGPTDGDEGCEPLEICVEALAPLVSTFSFAVRDCDPVAAVDISWRVRSAAASGESGSTLVFVSSPSGTV